jgi:hypothetical protein
MTNQDSQLHDNSMLDDLRREANDTFEEEVELPPIERRPVRILGMTSFQTFVIAFLFLLITCLLSSACLLATGRVAPSFF